MSDYQQIVDEIRFALQSEDCELTDELRGAAREYAVACHEVNQRLRKIETYLDGGLRSEAIQLAEGPPSVEETVGLLSFPELESWTDVVAIYDLPRPEPLNLMVVEALKEAQLIELPLQNLLNRHRLLSLHRAPLRLRLNSLRALREADPETFTWEEDVRTFEKARFQEMAEEIRTAQRQGNLAQLKQLKEDLSSSDWLEIPPARLTQSIRSGAGELTRQEAVRQLEELAPQLEAAFAELDFQRARDLSLRWKEAMKQAGQSIKTSVIEEITPILGWVQDEENREAAERQYQQLTAQLERALEGNSTLEELDRIAHEIQRMDRDIPELLAIRYQNRREAIQIGQARTHRLQLGSVLALVIALAVGITFLVRHQLRASEAERVARQVDSLIENDQLEEAQALLSKRNDVAQWDRLAALQSKIDKLSKDEQERQLLFRNSLAVARDSESHSDAMIALEKARSHALTAQEKMALNELQRAREKKRDEAMMARESSLGESIQDIGEQLTKLEAGMGVGTGDDGIGQALVEMTSGIAKLQEKSFGLRPELGSQVRLLAARRKELEELRNLRLNQQQRIEELTVRARILPGQGSPDESVERYRTALLEYAGSIPQEQTAAMYRDRAVEDQYWKAAVGWATAVKDWEKVWPDDLTEMSSRIAWCRQFLSVHTGAPDAGMVQRYLDQMEAIVSITGHIDGTGAGLQSRLARVFSSPLIEKSWCLKIKDGRIFYVPTDVKVTRGIPNFKYFVGYGSDDLDTQKKIPDSDFLFDTPIPSPSQILALSVKSRLESLPPENWNAYCLELCRNILANDELNPFLKLDLLKRCLELAANGDLFLKEQLQPQLKLLGGASINPLARWMNPDDAEGKKASDDARQILTHFQRLKPFDDVWKNADQQREQFTASVQRTVSMVGWLQPELEWTCHIKDAEKLADSDLMVVFVSDAGKTSEWRSIGQIKQGKVQFKSGVNEFLAAGRPVFAVDRPGQASANSQSSVSPSEPVSSFLR